MQLLAAAPDGGDQVCRLERVQVLGHALTRHVEVLAQVVQAAAVMRVQQVQQLAPTRVGEGFEEQIGVGDGRYLILKSEKGKY